MTHTTKTLVRVQVKRNLVPVIKTDRENSHSHLQLIFYKDGSIGLYNKHTGKYE